MVIAVLLVAGCIRDSFPEVDTGRPDAVLRLSTGTTITRGDGHYEDDPYAETNSEEAIHRVDLFFFDSASSEAASFYTCEIDNLTDVTTSDLTVKVPVDRISHFKDNKTAYVYALVNLPETVKVDADGNRIGSSSATLANLRCVRVDAPEFVGTGNGPAVPADFVMRGGADVTLTGEGKLARADGEIMLERLASKIRLWAQLPQFIYVNKATGRTVTVEEYEGMNSEERENVEQWFPIPKENDGIPDMFLYLRNIATRGRIDASLEDYEEQDRVFGQVTNGSKFARPVITGEGLVLKPADVAPNYPYSHTVAWYSYPNEWDSSTPTEEHQTYLILSMPWYSRKDDQYQFQRCYYQIPVNALDSGTSEQDYKPAGQLAPNTYYRIKIRLGMLGSKDLGEPTVVEDASWEAVPWKTADVDVSIRDRRYLVVNQKEWVVNNEISLTIPFSSSHETIITDCYVNYFRYNDVWGKSANTKSHTKEEFGAWVKKAHESLNDPIRGIVAETNGEQGEGYISATFTEDYYNGNNNISSKKFIDELYYKKEYFYDGIYDQLTQAPDADENKRLNSNYDYVYSGFRYYVGHEHPKTYRRSSRGIPKTFRANYIHDYLKNTTKTVSTGQQEKAWELYNKNEAYPKNKIYDYSINNETGLITVTHPLVRWHEVRKDTTISGQTYSVVDYYYPSTDDDVTQLYDEYSRCEIILKIRHKDWPEGDGLYEETIYITQYPGMYVEVSHDYGDVGNWPTNNNGGYTSFDNDAQKALNQYVLVNGNHTQSTQGTTQWYEVNKSQAYEYEGSNNNPNMYVITTTQLSLGSDYVIGDPRTMFYNNILDDESFKLQYTGTGNVPNNLTGTYSKSGYRDRNTADDNGYPLRWGEPNSAIADKGYLNSDGPAWWTSRTVSGNNNNYTYSNYEQVESKYTGKPANQNVRNGNDPPTSSRQWNDYINNKNNLCYYYPTDEASAEESSKAKFVAPSFRIASSFGKVTGTTNKTEARKRCATYQEAGRPAGRWRLATRAEIEYIAQLSADGKIPVLFGNTANVNESGKYWCANGPVDVTSSGNVTSGNGSVARSPRCVYDEWYWTQINRQLKFEVNPVETRFIWGDVPKDNVQTGSIVDQLINQP